jgi:hypothetical protein
MEAATLTLSGDDAGRFAEAFVDSKATEAERSLNKRGVRNIHRAGGEDGRYTQVAYERGSAYDSSWLMVSLLVERVDERTARVVVLVGGGGEGPFKLEELSMQRLLAGEESVGQAGRFASVLRDIDTVCDSLGVDVETEWASETESDLFAKLGRKIFDS